MNENKRQLNEMDATIVGLHDRDRVLQMRHDAQQMRVNRRDVLSDEEYREALKQRVDAFEQQRRSQHKRADAMSHEGRGEALEQQRGSATRSSKLDEDDELQRRCEALEQQRRSMHKGK